MNKTTLLTEEEARKKIKQGVDILSDIVTITLGAKGRNVAIAFQDYKGEIYKRDVIHDGVKVSKAVNLPNEYENMGAAILREAAEKTVMEVGDGTTVTIGLGQAIFNEAYKAIATGEDPVSIRLGLEKARERLIQNLLTYKIPVDTLDQAKHIAYISCQEKEIGDMIAETLEQIGTNGIFRIEESKNNKTTIEIQKGMQFDKGYIHKYFITDKDTMEATLEFPYILITDKSISSLAPFESLLNEISQRKSSLVILSPSLTGDALPFLIQNKLTGALPSLAIAAPSFGDNQKNILEDIATLTGGKVVSEDAGHEFENVTLKDLGRCEYITSDENSTIIVGGKGDKETLDAHIQGIKSKLETETDDFKLEKLKERLGKLTNGVAVIRVGGYTEVEMKERKERIDDAVHATRAAMRGGIVPGGEVVYLTLREILREKKNKQTVEDNCEEIANKILYKALEKPFNKLVENAGFDSGVMRERLSTSKIENKGVDIRDGKIKNMITAGIIDPLLVVKSALYNSISVAIILILTEGIIIPEGVSKNEKIK